ncbi:MAG: hypothetical protein JJE50_07805 [Actinomycetales bacterium]|nr:hypothetical protein [Actinomycetales bacterium]
MRPSTLGTVYSNAVLIGIPPCALVERAYADGSDLVQASAALGEPVVDEAGWAQFVTDNWSW